MQSDDESLVEQYRAILADLEAQPDGPDRRAFETYCGSLRSHEPAARYAHFVRSLVELAGVDLQRSRVLEAGCGFGMLCVSLAVLGAREVHGLELTPHRLVFVPRLRALLPQLPLQFHRGDVCRLPFRDASFEFLLVVEAISHFAEVDRFLDEAARVLSPGGVLLVSDGNNGANPLVRRRTEKYWARLELGAGQGAEIDAHGDARKPFVEARAEILQAELGLEAAVALEGAARTSGLRREEIVDAGTHFLDTGRWPDRVYEYGTCPMDPINRQYEEMLFDPLELGARLERLGFRCRVLPHFGGEARGGWTLKLNRALQRIPARVTTPLARGFRIVAVKA